MAPPHFRLVFHGGADEVTGSRHLVEYGEARVLLDCGLFQGHRLESIGKSKTFPAPPREISAVLLSHAHIDHSGGLPLLAKEGFAGPIHCTEPTADLLHVLLTDSAMIQEEDAKFFNKIHADEGLTIEPLYTKEDAERALSLLETHAYETPFSVGEGMEAVFHNAGHVLGSCMVRLTMKLAKRTRHLLFTGDLGRRRSLLLAPPQAPGHVDYLLIESTYGGRVHEPVEKADDVLAEAVNRSAETAGPLLIPSFALERTQEIVFLLEKLMREKRIAPIHVYVDSPMATNITHIFEKYRDHLTLSPEFRAQASRDGDPFGLRHVRYIRSVEESKKLTQTPGRKIIIAGSGMCEGGRILHHLRNLIGLDSTNILLVGYQAQGTLGRRLYEGAKKVKIFGLMHDRAARVHFMNHFSSHADAPDLQRFIQTLEPRPAGIFLVHGEREQREALAASLKSLGIDRVELPGFGGEFRLD